MRALSLSQPWASAVAFDLKSIETRSWRTSYTGPLAIHASMVPGRGYSALQHLLTLKPSLFGESSSALADSIWYQAWHSDDSVLNPEELANYDNLVRRLPPGAIVAVAMLYDCVPVEDVRDSISEQERILGDYSDGRWAWLLYKIESIEPVPCRGSLGLWTVPDDVAAQVERLVV